MYNSYGFKLDRDGVPRFHTLSIDANGNESESFKDVRERITSILQHNPESAQDDIWTSYYYNAVNELVQVKDDQYNVTQAIYDLSGRRTHLYNPDAGWTESRYDNSGNLVQKITANLRAEAKAITYDYDFNRLTNINYPNNTVNNVTYTYGNQANFLNVGRITSITDASGESVFEYGKLGETTKETRTLLTYTSKEPNTYTTQYRYDTWNRLRTITYPDGEILPHNYDSGGKLFSLQGKKGTYTYDYLRALTYDAFGQRVYSKYANGSENRYSYEEQRRRLSHLNSSNLERTFISNDYAYDQMQNITGISNTASVPVGSELFGGVASQSFSYDNLNQLKQANGSHTNRQGHQYRYNLAMSYDTIGNIKSKNQVNERLTDEDSKYNEQKENSYNFTYQHQGIQPHAPTHIGERTFSYDANGNQLGWENNSNGSRRTIVWDEENRITSISDNGQTSEYVYDANGDRTLKKGAQGETHYVNAYFVIREGEVASKHFFVGSQRIATKMAKQESNITNNGSSTDTVVYEHDQYYYHPDHLGSASFITDEVGKVFEHMEYFPFGDLWVHEHSNTHNTPYKFTGKEYDEVTGLYYFGARYYDPRVSHWMSVDPILEKYMDGKGNSGVFNPRNLSLFSYTYNNPVTLVDPDGKLAFLIPFVAALLGSASYANAPESADAEISTGPTEASALIPTAVMGGIAAKTLSKFKNSRGTKLNLKMKESWTKAQRKQAKMKAKQLTSSPTVVTKASKAKRSGTQSKFRKKEGLDSSTDADHTQELQLGGKDVMSNMQGLDSSVNKSFGKQIQNAIKDMPEGTKIGKVGIK
jgi:RHS repeat-associated protein